MIKNLNRLQRYLVCNALNNLELVNGGSRLYVNRLEVAEELTHVLPGRTTLLLEDAAEPQIERAMILMEAQSHDTWSPSAKRAWDGVWAQLKLQRPDPPLSYNFKCRY